MSMQNHGVMTMRPRGWRHALSRSSTSVSGGAEPKEVRYDLDRELYRIIVEFERVVPCLACHRPYGARPPDASLWRGSTREHERRSGSGSSATRRALRRSAWDELTADGGDSY